MRSRLVVSMCSGLQGLSVVHTEHVDALGENGPLLLLICVTKH